MVQSIVNAALLFFLGSSSSLLYAQRALYLGVAFDSQGQPTTDFQALDFGMGFDSVTGEAKRKCVRLPQARTDTITWEKIRNATRLSELDPDNPAVLTGGVSYLEESQNRETRTTDQLNLSATFGSGLYSGSASARFYSNYSLLEYGYRAVVQAHAQSEARLMDYAKLSPDRDVKQLNENQFRQSCGDYIVVGEIRGRRLSGTYKVKTREESVHKEVSAALSFAASGQSGQGSGYQQHIQNLSKSSIEFEIDPGSTLDARQGIATAADFYDRALKITTLKGDVRLYWILVPYERIRGFRTARLSVPDELQRRWIDARETWRDYYTALLKLPDDPMVSILYTDRSYKTALDRAQAALGEFLPRADKCAREAVKYPRKAPAELKSCHPPRRAPALPQAAPFTVFTNSQLKANTPTPLVAPQLHEQKKVLAIHVLGGYYALGETPPPQRTGADPSSIWLFLKDRGGRQACLNMAEMNRQRQLRLPDYEQLTRIGIYVTGQNLAEKGRLTTLDPPIGRDHLRAAIVVPLDPNEWAFAPGISEAGIVAPARYTRACSEIGLATVP